MDLFNPLNSRCLSCSFDDEKLFTLKLFLKSLWAWINKSYVYKHFLLAYGPITGWGILLEKESWQLLPFNVEIKICEWKIAYQQNH